MILCYARSGNATKTRKISTMKERKRKNLLSQIKFQKLRFKCHMNNFFFVTGKRWPNPNAVAVRVRWMRRLQETSKQRQTTFDVSCASVSHGADRRLTTKPTAFGQQQYLSWITSTHGLVEACRNRGSQRDLSSLTRSVAAAGLTYALNALARVTNRSRPSP